MSKMSVSSASAFVDDNIRRSDTHLFSTLNPYCDSRVSTESGLLVSEVFEVSIVVLHTGLHVIATDTIFLGEAFFLSLKVSFYHLGKIRWKSVIFLHLRSLCITEWW